MTLVDTNQRERAVSEIIFGLILKKSHLNAIPVLPVSLLKMNLFSINDSAQNFVKKSLLGKACSVKSHEFPFDDLKRTKPGTVRMTFVNTNQRISPVSKYILQLILEKSDLNAIPVLPVSLSILILLGINDFAKIADYVDQEKSFCSTI